MPPLSTKDWGKIMPINNNPITLANGGYRKSCFFDHWLSRAVIKCKIFNKQTVGTPGEKEYMTAKKKMVCLSFAFHLLCKSYEKNQQLGATSKHFIKEVKICKIEYFMIRHSDDSVMGDLQRNLHI